MPRQNFTRADVASTGSDAGGRVKRLFLFLDTLRFALPWVTLFVMLILLPHPAWASDKIALVVGNADYRNLDALPFAQKNAEQISDALKSAGFAGVNSSRALKPAFNLNGNEFAAQVQAFKARLHEAPEGSIGVLYYAGHGAARSSRGDVYLLPTDANLPDANALRDAGFALSDILQVLQAEKGRTIILIVDACRNVISAGPAEAGNERAAIVGASTIGAEPQSNRLLRGRSRDLAQETPDAADYFVAFSTSPDVSAYDAADEASFSAVLAREILAGRHDLLSLFKSVGEQMAEASFKSGRLQLPTFEVGLYHAPPCISATGCTATDPSRFYDCANCPWMRQVRPGSALLGTSPTETGRDASEPAPYPYEQSRSISIGVYEVTRAEWRACEAAGACAVLTSKETWQSPKAPIAGVRLVDAQAYVAWLSGQSGARYRLPNEEEWEYAARSGASGRFAFGDRVDPSLAAYDYSASYEGSPRVEYRGAPEAVGSFPPTKEDLFDLSGNVWEWTCAKSSDASRSCSGVLRGGSYKSPPKDLRLGKRLPLSPDTRREDVGLRVVRD